MLMFGDSRGIRGQLKADTASERLPGDIVWIDLLQPEPWEIGFVERITGLKVPSLEELSEIESSSRLRARDGALYLSAPLIYRPAPDQPISTPVGFVLTRDRLITVRFAELTSFASFADRPRPAVEAAAQQTRHVVQQEAKAAFRRKTGHEQGL